MSIRFALRKLRPTPIRAAFHNANRSRRTVRIHLKGDNCRVMSERSRPYQSAARYYKARPPYSDQLLPALSAKLRWDGTGRLIDVGCGPGVVAIQLSPGFSEVVGLDPEPAMLHEAARLTPSRDREKFRWIRARAEDIPELDLGGFQAVTLAQSFHWTKKERLAEIIYDILKEGGAMLLIHHNAPAFGPGGLSNAGEAANPVYPLVPHQVIDRVLVRWIGHGKPPPDPKREPYSDLLARTRFGVVERLILPGRRDLVRSVDQMIDNYLSTSFAAPELFGDRLQEFRAELSAELVRCTDSGFFWEWPGDTEVLIARKPGRS